MAVNGVNGAAYDDADIDYTDIEAKCVPWPNFSLGAGRLADLPFPLLFVVFARLFDALYVLV